MPSRSEAPPPARSEQNPAKKFSFPFRRKNRGAQNQNRNENFFEGHASEASGGGLSSLVPFKKCSSRVV